VAARRHAWCGRATKKYYYEKKGDYPPQIVVFTVLTKGSSIVSPNPAAYRIDTTVRGSTLPGAHWGVRVVYASGTASTKRGL